MMDANDDPDVFFAKYNITKWLAAKSKIKICKKKLNYYCNY